MGGLKIKFYHANYSVHFLAGISLQKGKKVTFSPRQLTSLKVLKTNLFARAVFPTPEFPNRTTVHSVMLMISPLWEIPLTDIAALCLFVGPNSALQLSKLSHSA